MLSYPSVTTPCPPSGPAAARCRAVRAAAALALLLAAAAARAEVEPLRVSWGWDLAVTAGAVLGELALSSSAAKPTACQWCDANASDAWIRDRLRWSTPGDAGRASDVIVRGVLPVAILANSFLSSWHGGAPEAFWEDALVVTQALALASILNGAAKDLSARRRPNAGLDETGSANRAFFSGHTTQAFAMAAAAGTVSSLRGHPSAPWVWAGGMTLAAGVGYLRVAGDQHWATDVLAGAAAGGLVGWAVPWVFHRVKRPDARVAVRPAPGGFALVF